MVPNEFELIINQDKRPLWKSLLAAAFFTFMLYEIYLLSLAMIQYGFVDEVINGIPRSILRISYSLAGGVFYAKLFTVLIDVDTNRLITRHHIGLLSYDQVKNTPEFEYIAIYIDSYGEFQSSLWYKGNRHIKLFGFGTNDEAAMAFANHVSQKLKIDILDKRVKGQSEWIEYPTPAN